MEIKALLILIVKEIVDSPEEVRVNEVVGTKSTVLELAVIDEDRGKVIGKKGRTAHSLRIILSAAAATQGRHEYALSILE